MYGDPCRECGYDWSIETAQAIELVLQAPQRYRELLNGDRGTTRGAGLEWSTGGYVCHVVDNLRIWAERLAGAAHGSTTTVVPYDAELLAHARRYEAIGIDAALWSLARASADWSQAVEIAQSGGATVQHPDRGELAVSDVIKTNAHDCYHHAWDITRILAAPTTP